MRDVLVVYATNHGHTEKVAARIAEALRDAGTRPEVHDVKSAATVSPVAFDAAIVGGSVHSGHHQREIVDWAKRHAIELNSMPSGFFSVSLTAAEDTEESRRATRSYIDDFIDDTGWTPAHVESVAGALEYREYDFVTRLLMRLLMQRDGHPTDWSRDYVYTDWDAVERFARDCGAARPVAPTDEIRA